MSRPLHIVCLDAPSPADYGGAIDMYYKIKALAQAGREITLHYFAYREGRGVGGLENNCAAIYAYQRKPWRNALPLSRPFIVQSRINHELINRLNNHNDPILLEGLHCAGLLPFLNHPERVVLRMHNNEAAYYGRLAKTEKNFLKRLYFLQESRLLKTYQQGLDKTLKLAFLSQTDLAAFHAAGFRYGAFTPCFIPWQKINGKAGSGNYCLYHGNLSVSENEEAALWLIEKVFSNLPFLLVIAGGGISNRLQKTAARHKNVRLVLQPREEELNGLLSDAHINVLPSFNSTGVKLKLLHALFNGRHCLTNAAGVAGSQPDNAVVEEEARDWITRINALMQEPFTEAQQKNRQALLAVYNNVQNAALLNAQW